MTILGLYDEDNAETRGAMTALSSWAEENGHRLILENAAALKLGPCIGCFGCWLKTPGECVIAKDDGRAIAKEIAVSDLFVILTKIPFGSYAPSIKRALDRSIPDILPFFRIYKGEMHHVPRYSRKRKLIHIPYGEASAEELETFKGLAQAHCDNFDSPHVKKYAAYDGDTRGFIQWLSEEASA